MDMGNLLLKMTKEKRVEKTSSFSEALDQQREEGIKFLEEEDIQKLFKEAQKRSTRDYAILVVMYYRGLRASEVGRIGYPEDLKIDSKGKPYQIYIRRLKGGNAKWYDLGETERKALEDWLKSRNFSQDWEGSLFPSSRRQGISRKTIHRLITMYCSLAGVEKPKGKSTHLMRHSCATHLHERAGATAVDIRDWLGQKSISSAEIYIHASKKRIKEIAEKFTKVEGKEKLGGKIKWKN